MCLRPIFNLALVFGLGLCAPNQVMAALCTSTGSGDWETGGTWDCGGVPSCGDTIVIAAGHTVNVTTNNSTLDCGSPSYVIIEGVLDFGNGDKLNLGCGSGLTVENGGTISASGSGGGSSNQITICGSTVWSKSDGDVSGPATYGTPLSVELVEFTAARTGKNTAKLSWTTISETENDRFVILKSSNLIEWMRIDSIAGAGTYAGTSSYEYVDYQVTELTTYYKLMQVDYNGSVKYYGPVGVQSYELGQVVLIPNPATEYIEISELPNNVPHQLIIHDVFGRVVENIHLSENRNKVYLDNIPSGNYILRISNDWDHVSRGIIIR